MNKIKLKMNYCCFDNEELKNYLLNINGINNVETNDEEITIEYTKDISNYMIVSEIKLFTNNLNVPCIYYFNKYTNKELQKFNKNIEDFCCEYCLNGFIEQLLYIEGISEVYSNYEELFSTNNKLNITIYYDDNKLNEGNINKLMETL